MKKKSNDKCFRVKKADWEKLEELQLILTDQRRRIHTKVDIIRELLDGKIEEMKEKEKETDV